MKMNSIEGPARSVVRRSLAYTLESARMLSIELDLGLVSTLILIMITRSALNDSIGERIARGQIFDLEFDPSCKPVSVYAVSKELRLPYETVRRHVAMLRGANCLQVVKGGVLISSSLEVRSQLLDILKKQHARGQALTSDIHLLLGIDKNESIFEFSELHDICSFVELFIILLRICSDSLELDYLDVLIFLSIGLHNLGPGKVKTAEHMSHARLQSIMSDENRKPVSAHAISTYLNIPAESIRRRCTRLAERKLIRRKTGGLIILSHVVNHPDLAQPIDRIIDTSMHYISSRQIAPKALTSDTLRGL